MDHFEGRIAVVTGGGTGMGRELARQLSSEGCHVAMCDVSATNMAETVELCRAGAPSGTRVTSFVADVAQEEQLVAFRDAVITEHATDHIHLLFNNAGIGGGGSFVSDPRPMWEATFNVCWGGVYLGCRTFMPMLIAAPEGHVVNTSSVNGFWASLGPDTPHTAYSAAKFAVKGFTEALITDLRMHAPHVTASVVMPGHIGTSIVLNSGAYFGLAPTDLTPEQQLRAESFRDNAPTTAAQAATIILDGVRAGQWRILVGDDAVLLDELVRQMPNEAYSEDFTPHLRAQRLFGLSTQ